MPHDFFRGRHAGVLVPLFSIPSRESWGIGEIPDIARLGSWTVNAGFDFVQLLPLNEMAEGQNSPYSALSAMALDPVFIAPANVPEVRALGGEAVLDSTERDLLQRVRAARGIEYAAVRAIKRRVLRLAFERFLTNEWHKQTRRAQALKAFMDQERWWLDEYTLFRAVHAREDGRYWREWDPALRDREPSALEEAREELRGERVFHAYLQWLAAEQWVRARAESRVGIFGDFPFMVSGDSADVWSRQQDFRLDASVGTPPDAFSVTGQDWGFPVYRWTEIASGGYEWLAARARRSAELYDGYRVDHLVGFFRTFVREADGTAAFVPSAEPAQIAQGERLLTLFANAGARVIAEDLGLIPDFVRDTMARLGIAGYKVLRWEREWLSEGQPFRDPLNYPTCSVVTSSTHDTETLADWWDEASQTDRQATMAIPFLERMGCDPAAHFRPEIRDAIIELLFASASDLLLLPIQDAFGWRDRINTPALISEQNWAWRLSWPVEDLQSEPAARERAGFLRRLADRYHRRLT
jgi:4-alpha-glucanotransferase